MQLTKPQDDRKPSTPGLHAIEDSEGRMVLLPTWPSVDFQQAAKEFSTGYDAAEPIVEINRNQYFMIGVVLLALGIQFRMVDSVTLTNEASQFISKRFVENKAEAGEIPAAFVSVAENVSGAKQRTIKPPQWLGWALISMGSVLVLHSLAMPKPG